MSDTRIDWEMEMASAVDVLNKELRINGPIEVEQYKPGTMKEGVRKLVDYLRDKIERRESQVSSLRAQLAAAEAVVRAASFVDRPFFLSDYEKNCHELYKAVATYRTAYPEASK